jgi:riboflavin kinase/FMN adenylyltransferase
LVLPADTAVLSLPPAEFLDSMIATVCVPLAVHVGEDFRFGAQAAGDLQDLYVWGVEVGVEVRPHPLLEVDGAPVTSTRIRSLVSQGEVREATELLGRPHTVAGTVHVGKGRGVALGFPTANITPQPGITLPADGVYAARVQLPDSSERPAAVSVGLPPTFPDAHDQLEAHLIGFEGDLTGVTLRVLFLERLRALQKFGSVYSLAQAIGDDVRRAADVLGLAPPADAAYLDEDGVPFVDDPLALESAERAVAALASPSAAAYSLYDESWVPVYGPVRLSSLLRDGGVSAALITGPLSAADIPFVWDPFPPSSAQSARPDLNWQRSFTLLVSPTDLASAREALAPILGD